jgi:hypothetical protein
MTEQAIASEQPAAGWRLKLGVAIFALSIISPVVGIPVVAALDLSATMTATLSGILFVSGEVFLILAVAVMGKAGFAFIKSRIFGFLRQYGPPKAVSRGRYTIGLVMFWGPIFFGWVAFYFANQIPGFLEDPLPYAVGGDLVLLASLFVLGGDFWDKLRSLFIHEATALIPQKPAAGGSAH